MVRRCYCGISEKNIHMDQIKGQAATQITLEDDVNIRMSNRMRVS